MGKPLTTSRDKRKKQRNNAFLRISLVLLPLIALVLVYYRAVIQRETLDPVTLCPPKPQSVTVLLVDVTDPMNLPQRQDFINQLERLITRIPRYGKLVVTKVDPVSDRLLSPVITRCNPGSASDVSEVTGNPQQVEGDRNDNFLAPMRNAFDTLLSASAASRSPILESIQSVVLTELQRPELAGVSRTLVVASDLLQHTDQLTFYHHIPTGASFITTQTFSRLRTDLRGISVELWMLQRNDSNLTQPRALPDLWDAIIDSQGGKLSRLYVVSG